MVKELSFQDYSDRLPPQNIEAEEAVLGGILLDPEAMGRIADLLMPEAFYIQAHKEIYKAALALYNQEMPTDLMSVTTWLSDREKLDKVGGQSKLVQLVERTVSAVNIDQYATLIVDKFLRRKLIQSGNEVVRLGYDTATPLSQILDKAEQQIFNITQDRPQQGLTAIGDTLVRTFEDIEVRHENIALPGLPCGFYDLDAMTGGFQRSDLTIVAGRPSMGKCLTADAEILLADGSVRTIAEIVKNSENRRGSAPVPTPTSELLTLGKDGQFTFAKPSGFLDDGIKPVFWVKTRQGRSLKTTITHPFLTADGWQSLSQLQVGDKIAVPRKLEVFGQQRISQEKVEQLADQVAEGIASRGATRSAGATRIPPIIFTLQRSLVVRFLQRLFASQGKIVTLENQSVCIVYPTEKQKVARQLQHLLLRFGIVAAVTKPDNNHGNWQVEICDGPKYRCLGHHRDAVEIFLNEIGVFQLGGPSHYQNSLYKGDSRINPTASVSQKSLPGKQAATATATLEKEATPASTASHICWDEIVEITPLGKQRVYDLTIPQTHNFVANDICVHNTSFALNIARNIAAFHELPVAVFSLEMSKEQLVQRLLSGEAGIESNRLRAGRISQSEWEPLGNAIANLSELPIFIDDTPNITVTEIRSKCRRLQAEQGGELGLILLDYLQLMEGGNSDNRVQELARITRSLKGLARELRVPLISLSQLSRSVETRNNKRPMMSDLRESGCLTGDTLIFCADTNQTVPIRDLMGKSHIQVWAYNWETQQLEKATVSNAFSTGIRPVYCLQTQSGYKIKATGNHKFFTPQGWQRLDRLAKSDRIAIKSEPVLPSVSKFTDKNLSTHFANQTSLATLPKPTQSILWDSIASITPLPQERVYDLTVPHLHNFVANNIVVHNSIEQDADLIIMLYRDEYYNPDTPDRGLAEIIITKHRNGPTGNIKLLFNPQFTQFRNMAAQ
ncbi:replicative DNA helicase [Geitlerinema sp. PCC 9228]|uniref:replicative DNA helicase n=1 Tax=Geitlerinema sp. PCC 9228 TaxID=111611 RepID=UPI0008F9C468|nr:replicative DNA helicase [Geitlerinema sp. PCC 9228]